MRICYTWSLPGITIASHSTRHSSSSQYIYVDVMSQKVRIVIGIMVRSKSKSIHFKMHYRISIQSIPNYFPVSISMRRKWREFFTHPKLVPCQPHQYQANMVHFCTLQEWVIAMWDISCCPLDIYRYPWQNSERYAEFWRRFPVVFEGNTRKIKVPGNRHLATIYRTRNCLCVWFGMLPIGATVTESGLRQQLFGDPVMPIEKTRITTCRKKMVKSMLSDTPKWHHFWFCRYWGNTW